MTDVNPNVYERMPNLDDEAAYYNRVPILSVLKQYLLGEEPTTAQEEEEAKGAESNKTLAVSTLGAKGALTQAPSAFPIDILEIASGSGQHAGYFTSEFSKEVIATITPTEYDPAMLPLMKKVCAEAIEAGRVQEPQLLDVCSRAHWQDIVKKAPGTKKKVARNSDSTTTEDEKLYDLVLVTNLTHIAPWDSTLGLMNGASRSVRDEGLLIVYGPFKQHGEFTTESNKRFDQWLKKKDPRFGLRDISEVAAASPAMQLIDTIPMPENNFILVFKKPKNGEARQLNNESDLLQACGAEAYWNDRWCWDYTGWKRFESGIGGAAFEHDLFTHNLKALQSAASPVIAGLAAEESSASPPLPPRGAPQRRLRVLLPLCGDSPVLTYFLHDYLTAMGLNDAADSAAPLFGVDVVGIDLASEGLRSVRNHSRNAELTFTEDTVKAPSSGSDEFKVWKTATKEGNTLTLIQGDFFKVCGDYLSPRIARGEDAPFHLSYDRASFVAIHPTLRETYVDAISAILAPKDHVTGIPSVPVPSVVIELMQRFEGKRQTADGNLIGPPFHVSDEELQSKFYTVDQGFGVPPVHVEHSAKMKEFLATPNLPMPPFRFKMFALLRASLKK